MKEGTENVMKKRSYWAGIAALALSLLLTGCGMELSDPADGVDNAPGLCTEDSGPALDAVVGTDGLDTAGDEEDGTADTLPAAPEEDPVSHQVVLLDANGLGRTAELMIR